MNKAGPLSETRIKRHRRVFGAGIVAEVVVITDVMDTDPPGADVLEELVRDWKRQAVRSRPQLWDMTITVDLDEIGDSGDSGVTYWHFYFELGQESFEALSDGKLDTFAFVDEAGYFEDHVSREEVPQRIAKLFSGQ